MPAMQNLRPTAGKAHKAGKLISAGNALGDGIAYITPEGGHDGALKDARGEGLRQFPDFDDARFFLLADAKMDAISGFEAIDQSWLRHAEGHFHGSHEIAGRSDWLVIQ